LRLVVGDIANQDTDAVVTAAHWRLNKVWARMAPFSLETKRHVPAY